MTPTPDLAAFRRRYDCCMADLAPDVREPLDLLFVEMQGRIDALSAALEKCRQELELERRDKKRLWGCYRLLSGLYHKSLRTVRDLRGRLGAREIVWRAVRRDLRQAMAEDRAREDRGVVGEDGIAGLLGGGKR